MSDMSDILRKMGLFGIGVISLTQEKIEEFTAEMIKKGEMSREEGKKFVRDVLSEKEKQLKEMEDKINQKVKEAIGKSGAATKSDFEALEKKIEILERSSVTRVDVDILERRIKELELAMQSMTK